MNYEKQSRRCPYCGKNAYVQKVNVEGNTIHSELKCHDCGAIFGHYTVIKQERVNNGRQ